MKMLTALLLLLLGISRTQAAPPAVLEEKHRAFLQTYCTECHRADKTKGKVRLDDISFTLDSVQRADLWQKVLNAINSGEMPPEDKKQPDRALKTEFLGALSETLVVARNSLSDVQGNITMRRLNRREYRNTLRDLLGVEIDVRELPADGGAGTFDTVGASLFLSSDQLEQYLTLGRRALDEHFARTAPRSAQTFKAHVEPEKDANRRLSDLKGRLEKRFENFQKWSEAIDAFAAKPENEAATASLEKGFNGWRRPIAYYRTVAALPGAPSPKDFGFSDVSSALFNGADTFYHNHRSLGDYLQMPHTDSGAYLGMFVPNPKELIAANASWPAGRYILRIRAAAVEGSAPHRRFLEIGQPDPSDRSGLMDDSGTISVLNSVQIHGTISEPQLIEIPVEITLNGSRRFVLREKRPNTIEGAYEIWREHFAKEKTGPKPAIWIDWIELEGPIPQAPNVAASTAPAVHRFDPETVANPQLEKQLQQLDTRQERFTRWQAEVDRAAAAPENQEILAELKKKDPILNTPGSARLYYHADALRGAPNPKDFALGDASTAAFGNQMYGKIAPYLRNYLALPARNQGAYLTIQEAYARMDVPIPASLAPGNYRLRMRAGTVDGTAAERHFIEIGEPDEGPNSVQWNLKSISSTHQVTGTVAHPEILEIPIQVLATAPLALSIRERQPAVYDAASAFYFEQKRKNGYGPDPAIWIDYVELVGPLANPDTSLRPLIDPQTAGLPEPERARAALAQFTQRAFRGHTPDPSFLEKLQALYESRRNAGDPFELALRKPLSVVLASPGFLYLSEPGEEKKPRDLSTVELASRLSYFLWSAPPDAALLAAHLADPAERVRQVHRLIASPKADEFVRGFVHQWLGMERLDFFQFDTKQFRDFDESTKAAARREVYETFAHLLREKGSLTRLLKSDEIYVNGMLATYYGVEGVSGDVFQKVRLPDGSPRGGLLGMAAILAMGSNGERTSPVERGAWVLRKLLHAPPPPAPPNVPQINRLEKQLLTTRQRLGAHQEEPQCLQCHRKIDPIGFGLENFNAAGKWRTDETYEKKGVGKKTWPIDASGQFHNGPAFRDYFELRDHIAARPEPFARGFSEALIEYALGRPYGFTDAPLADSIVTKAEQAGYALSEFLVALVTSRDFGSK
ncbi:MAG: hypothetical protein RLZZ399_1147 [Verrucomicrobiota bacterium]|jgi:hypothetical protein